MTHVVVVGDERTREELRMLLSGAGMELRAVLDEHEAESLVVHWPGHIVVIDGEVLGDGAFALATRLRLSTRAGIVMLVARSRRKDRLRALSLGVDQCFSRPLDSRATTLELRNLYRRLDSHAQVGSSPPAASGSPPSCPWRFDPAQWMLIAPDGRPVQLSLAEFHLLRSLMQHAGDVVQRAELLRALDRGSVGVDSRNLDMIVSRLRKKVEQTCGERLPVHSARGVGYVFTGHGEIAPSRTPTD